MLIDNDRVLEVFEIRVGMCKLKCSKPDDLWNEQWKFTARALT